MSPRKRAVTPVASVHDFNEMLGLLVTGIGNRFPNNLQYEPHDKQLRFHKSQKLGRQLLGGNRSGKTVCGINEDIWWLTGRHPYIKLPPPPIIGRVTTVDFKNGANKIILPQLKQWLPPSDLINGSWEDSYDAQKHVLTLANDSELEIMSYDQELDKLAGVPRHFIHFDEEPPEDIFKECKARLIDYNGRWWMTMTPVEGMTWTFDEIYEKARLGTELIEVVEVDIHDNKYLTDEAIENFLADADDNERQIRGKGKYIAISGLVFKNYDPRKHVLTRVEFDKPLVPDAKQYEHYLSLDAGFNNPTAVLWHAVNKRDGTIITYDEHYKREMTIEQHSEIIKEKEAFYLKHYGIVPFLRIADPAIKQRQQVTGLSVQIEYSMHGINLALGAKRDVDAGLDKMINYLRLGKWFITDSCPNLQTELRKYKRAQYATSKLRAKNNRKEEPQKKDDHAIDSTRYFFSFMPELNPNQATPSAIVKPNLLGVPTITLRYPQRIDEGLIAPQTGVYIIDEYVGEY